MRKPGAIRCVIGAFAGQFPWRLQGYDLRPTRTEPHYMQVPLQPLTHRLMFFQSRPVPHRNHRC